jgi:iron complex outermembrane receptor protein
MPAIFPCDNETFSTSTRLQRTLAPSILAAFLLLTGTGSAQSLAPLLAPDPPTQTTPKVELSPFVVSAESESGWSATETLAGTRLRTSFKDVPNQIETFTQEFMADLGVTNAEQALMYSANVENQGDFLQTPIGNTLIVPLPGGRVRGLGATTLSRNFFQVQNPTDNFNLERVTVASGPNAILFGLGSPAGILDATPARAAMRNQYGITLQYDSEDSKRATFDANTQLIPRKAAMRLMGLSQQAFTARKPNFDRDERLYAALTLVPSKNTTIVVQGERAKRDRSRVDRINTTDFVTLWDRAHEIPGSGYATPRPHFDNTDLTGIANSRIFDQAGDAPVLVSGRSGGLQSWRNSVTVKNPSALPSGDPALDASIEDTLLDGSVFPLEVNAAGTAKQLSSHAWTKTVIIEQKVTKGLFLELAYNREKALEQHFAVGSDLRSNLYVDPNRFVPGTRTLNPNFGKLYVQGPASTEPEYRNRADWRATLFYEWDFQQHAGARPWKWLGRHRLSGLYSGSRAETKTQFGLFRQILDEPTITGLTLQPKTVQNWAVHSTRTPLFRHYFDTPYDTPTPAGPANEAWSLTDANGKPFTLYLIDTPLRTADGKRLSANFPAVGNRTSGVAHILTWQGFFLPDRENRDRLVLTFGYRRDSAKSATLDGASTTQDFSGLYPVLWDTHFGGFRPAQTGVNRTLGVVAHPLPWLGAFYSHSTTFDLNIGRYDPFGRDLHGAGGKGKEYGLRLDLWAGKLAIRINRYENSLGPQRASNQINIFRDVLFNLEERVRSLDPQAPTINITDGNQLGFRVAGRPNYLIVSDLESTGYEFELNATPGRHWNIRLNGAISDAVESNIGNAWHSWVAQRLPVWKAVVARNGEVDSRGRPVTWSTAPLSVTTPTGRTLEEYYNNAWLGQAVTFMRAVEGRATHNARGARANIITNYRFGEGALRGFNIGGAIRWRAAPTIGYGVLTDAAGNRTFDLNQPWKGIEELYFDALAGYRGRLKALGGLQYRLQLNVRNVLNEDNPVPAARITTGAIVKAAFVEPRVFALTLSVEF